MKQRIAAMGALLCAYTTMFASGFQTLEQGASNLGTATAGATVNANGDATAAFWNPSAGFASGLKIGETKVDVGVDIILSKFDFNATRVVSTIDPSLTGRTGKSGDAGCVSAVPNLYILHRLSEDFMLSFSLSAPYALETDYDANWVGRQTALNSNLTTFDFNPSLAYKINEYITINGGISAQWLHANLSSMPFSGIEACVTGQSFGIGGNAGFTINYAEDGRVGFQWRSEVFHDIAGNNHMNGIPTDRIGCDLNLPHSFTVGWYQRLRGDLKKFAVMADYSYTLWSSFDRLYIYKKSGGYITNQEEAWRNTSRIAAGVHFFPLDNDDLVIRLGSAWDQTPITDPEHRYSRIPCTDRIWFSGGVGYKYGNFNIDLAYTFIYFYQQPEMNDMFAYPGVGYTDIDGYFSGRAHVIALQVGYKF